MNSIDDILERQVELVLIEDIGPGDITTLACVDSFPLRAEIVAKSNGVLAGLAVASLAFMKRDEKVKIVSVREDGDYFQSGEKILSLAGNSRAILTGERTALNFLGHLSGIATLTSKFVAEVEGTGVKILDTRKTTPGLRYLEKYAVTCGGGMNHRFGLYDMVLIKDNHIAACGSIKKALERIKAFFQKDQVSEQFGIESHAIQIEVEIVDEEQLREAIASGVKRLLLDNQSIDELAHLVKLARSLSDDVLLEASGNVRLENVRQIAETGVDFISIGVLTHSAPASDFSLRVLI
jgi:nicotinate-nucleotide pyrophosphorylase (carboxylating)